MHKYVLLMLALFVGLALWNVGEQVPQENKPVNKAGAGKEQVADPSTPGNEPPTNIVKEHVKPKIDIGCDDAPKAAVTTLGPELAEIASLKCTIYGHILAPPKGVVWNTGYGVLADLGGYPIPSNLPAYVPTEEEREISTLHKVGHAAYFTDFQISVLNKDEAEKVVRARGGKFATADAAELPEVTQVLATNNAGVDQKVFFFDNFQGEKVGYFCRPECDAQVYFTAFEWLQASDIYVLDEAGTPLRDEEGKMILKNGKP